MSGRRLSLVLFLVPLSSSSSSSSSYSSSSSSSVFECDANFNHLVCKSSWSTNAAKTLDRWMVKMRKNPYCFITRFEDDFHGKEEIKEETVDEQMNIFYSVEGEKHGISLTYIDVDKTCLSRITLFRRNVEVGPSWDFSMGHSRPMLAVTINMNKVSGTHIWGGGAIFNNTTWIYPDLSTVLVGNFSENRLFGGREGKITRVICNNGIMQIETETVASDQTYSFEFDSLNSLGSFPTLQDPFEAKYLKVDSSPLGGEGIFARTNLPTDRLIGYFHGIKIPKDTLYESWLATDGVKLLSESERSEEFIRRKSYIIALNYEHDIDMPPDIGEDATKYNATLGHKVNHSFHPNSFFGWAVHPRFGSVRGLFSRRSIKTGEEITVDYGYKLYSEDTPSWYKELYKQTFM